MNLNVTPTFETASTDGTSGKLFDENALTKNTDKERILINFKNVNVHNTDNDGHAMNIMNYKV